MDNLSSHTCQQDATSCSSAQVMHTKEKKKEKRESMGLRGVGLVRPPPPGAVAPPWNPHRWVAQTPQKTHLDGWLRHPKTTRRAQPPLGSCSGGVSYRCLERWLDHTQATPKPQATPSSGGWSGHHLPREGLAPGGGGHPHPLSFSFSFLCMTWRCVGGCNW